MTPQARAAYAGHGRSNTPGHLSQRLTGNLAGLDALFNDFAALRIGNHIGNGATIYVYQGDGVKR